LRLGERKPNRIQFLGRARPGHFIGFDAFGFGTQLRQLDGADIAGAALELVQMVEPLAVIPLDQRVLDVTQRAFAFLRKTGQQILHEGRPAHLHQVVQYRFFQHLCRAGRGGHCNGLCLLACQPRNDVNQFAAVDRLGEEGVGARFLAGGLRLGAHVGGEHDDGQVARFHEAPALNHLGP